jgi:isoleucyl-tRNA synthetase
LAELKGTDLEGWTYDGPYDDLEAEQEPGGHTELRELTREVNTSAAEAHRVILWSEVGEEEGTGIVHIAPGCGAEDFQLGKQFGLPIVAPLTEDGYFVDKFGWLSGRHVSEVAESIFEDLKRKGRLYHVAKYTHRYPTCWRCKTELVFRLVDEWFISMDELRYDMMEVTKKIRWIPSFGLDRELDWLRNMHDWMISKKRYWGLALPFWECAACHHVEVIGDEEELRARAISGWETFAGHTPHRPYVDAVKIACPQCGAVMERIPDVGNPWLDAGIVSFSTLGYRFDREYWKKWYPAHWISESFPGQFRNWFYSLLAMATVIENSPPFLQNFGYATLFAEDGRPMHKSWGNSIEFNEAADKMGVDVMRWLYCASKPEANLLFGYSHADEVRRQFLLPLWNVYNFFVGYAKLDGWEPSQAGFDPDAPEGSAPQSSNTLDRWIIARINQVIGEVTPALESSDACAATASLAMLLDDLTNWYVRRSRRRFWKSEHDADKQTAYGTLYYVLVRLLRLLAPFTPFVTEVMYQNLVRAVQPQAHASVHHCLWPVADAATLDAPLLEQMALARSVASLGLGARGAVNIKVRQPLATAFVYAGDARRTLNEELAEIVADEVNVKKIEFVNEESRLVTYRLVADGKLLGRKLGSKFPKVKAALAAAVAAPLAQRLRAGLPIEVVVEGESITLAAEEVIVHTESAAGLAVVSDKGVTVAIDATITPALRDEGLVRDLVRAVQTLRKDADYRLDDHITVGLLGLDEEARGALASYGDYLRQETLCDALLLEDDGGAWDKREAAELGKASITVAVRR